MILAPLSPLFLNEEGKRDSVESFSRHRNCAVYTKNEGDRETLTRTLVQVVTHMIYDYVEISFEARECFVSLCRLFMWSCLHWTDCGYAKWIYMQLWICTCMYYVIINVIYLRTDLLILWSDRYNLLYHYYKLQRRNLRTSFKLPICQLSVSLYHSVGLKSKIKWTLK
jgi:hypothetical protein